MPESPPKIHLIPDGYHIKWVGRLKRDSGPAVSFFLEAQLAIDDGTVDYVCCYRFDEDGVLDEHAVVRVGRRGEASSDALEEQFQRQIDSLGDHQIRDVWVRPFKVIQDGHEFGLIPVQCGKEDSSEWVVEAMPGNTLSFYAPWELGEYDT